MTLRIQLHLSGLSLSNSPFSNCVSHADAETADEWLRSFAFAWNLLI